MSEWKPIEAAPKDGTDILIWSQNEYWIGLWLKSKCCFVDDCYEIFEEPPTHWMPLPTAPTVETKE